MKKIIHKIILTSILTIACSFSDILAISYEPNSVLSSGTWYKLAVLQKEGEINASGTIFKLDYTYLQNTLGIDPSSIDPKKIKIYGGKTAGTLPQSYLEATTDDIDEIPIYIEGEDDGIFHPSDYILFYGNFAHNWKFDVTTSKYVYDFNYYGDSSFFYLTIDNSSDHETLATSANESGATVSITSFEDHYHYEKEALGTVSDGLSTGRNMLSSQIFNNNQKSFSLPKIPNVVTTGNSFLNYSITQAINTSSSATCELFVNNNTLGDVAIPATQDPYFDIYKILFGELPFTSSHLNSSSNNSILLKNKSSNFRVYLDWLEIKAQRELTLTDDYLYFSADSNVNNTATYTISGLSSNHTIWDVSNPADIQNQVFSTSSFSTTTGSMPKQFIAFDKTTINRSPTFVETLTNQDLHGATPTELLIITHSLFVDKATELANHRASAYGISTSVVTIDKIYNEFSAGKQDPTAIRNYIRMLHEKAPGTLKYVLLFGDGLYNYKNYNTTSFIAPYQSRNWNNNVESFQSDDYYALLEDGEGEWKVNAPAYNLDIAIGRIPVRSVADATIIVNKLKRYDDPELTKGDWKTKSIIISDDGHTDLFIRQGESSPSKATDTSSINFVTQKIYMDSYEQISSSSGNAVTAPKMKEDVVKIVNEGALLLTYIGHGSTTKLTDEKITSPVEIKNEWLNKNKLPIVLIGSCSFGKFDNPSSSEKFRNTGTDAVLYNENEGGGIAILSPTRFVFATSNGLMVDNFYESFTSLLAQDRHATLGDIYKSAKNNTYTEQGFGSNQFNNRNFSLLGDPSMRINVPKYAAVIDSINGNEFNASINDTLSSLDVVEINGSIKNNGAIVSNFTGTVTVEIMDKNSIYTTLGSSLGGDYNSKASYKVREKSFFKGSFSVVDGKFTVSVIMPKYLSTLASGEFGKISLHAFSTDSLLDASGAYTNISYQYSPATNCTADCDVTPPEITIAFADSSRVGNNNVMKNASFSLLISDRSGINTSSESIGRDILVEIRNTSNNKIVAQYPVNNLFSYDLNSTTTGSVKGLNLQDNLSLDAGNYSMRVIAWDVYDNVRYETINFSIENTFKATANPNPVDFTFDAFEFNLSYDFVDEATETIVEIVNQSGNVVKTMTKSTEGIPDENINIYWNGTSDGGEKVAPGIYIYRITVTSLTSEKKAKTVERLVIAQ